MENINARIVYTLLLSTITFLHVRRAGRRVVVRFRFKKDTSSALRMSHD